MANLLIEKKERIGIVAVNRPEQLNSMNSETRAELAEAFTKLESDNDIEVILLTGAKSKAFIAGADIKEFLKRKMDNQEDLEKDWIVTKIISNLTTQFIALIVELVNSLLYTSPSQRDQACNRMTSSA